MKPQFDTIVIGAGLAGIAAAERLSRAGQRIALIEARERLGGRVYTKRDPLVDLPLEMGPEWFGESGPLHRVMASAGLDTPKGNGSFLRRTDGELSELDNPGEAWKELHQRLAMHRGADRSLESALLEYADTPGLQEAAGQLRGYVSGFHAADPSDLSLAWLRQVERNQSAGESELRTRVGLDQGIDVLLRRLTSSCTAFPSTIVRSVRWQRGHVAAECASGAQAGTITARCAIVTLPLSVLQLPAGTPGAVQFTPALTAKRAPLSHLAMGPAVKLNMIFDAAFWRDLPRLGDALFIQDLSQPLPTWWTSRPVETPVLIGWAAGTQVQKVGSVEPEALQRTAIQSLAGVFAVSPALVARRLRAWYWHDWQADPFAHGAYSWVRTGGVDAHTALARPMQRTLFFAGEATCGKGYNATMDGALESGYRAADEVMAMG